MDRREALDWVKAVQIDRFEGSEVEVKAARRGLPRRLYETLSAFANRTGGGVVILGLDETHGFAVVGVDDPQQTLAELSDQASRTALAYLRVNSRMTNSDYRRLNNATTVEATRELRGLVNLGLIEMHGTRRWAYYTLGAAIPIQVQPREAPAVGDKERVLAYLREYGAITNSECRELLGLGDDERRARYVLGKMIKQGLICKVGTKRWTRYELL